MDSDNVYTRYARQIPLPGLGSGGQQLLQQARVLVIGAGGLGCPVLQYLAAAGVGTIGIADGDKVALSNLHRQVLYTTEDIGELKARIAAQKIQAVNPAIYCEIYTDYVTNKSAYAMIGAYDIIVDCTDNFTARYLINDACFLQNKPLVFAAVLQFEGQVAIFNISNGTAPACNYRDLFPEPPSSLFAPDCNTAGVLGVLPGLLGTLQAAEVIKIITGIGKTLAGKILHYDLRTHNSMVMELEATQQAREMMPRNREHYESLDYEWLCNSASVRVINRQQLNELLAAGHTIAIDVRERTEMPRAVFPHTQVPMSLINQFPAITDYHNIVVFCQSGARSAKVAKILGNKYGTSKNIYHLAGGITGYNLPAHE